MQGKADYISVVLMYANLLDPIVWDETNKMNTKHFDVKLSFVYSVINNIRQGRVLWKNVIINIKHTFVY